MRTIIVVLFLLLYTIVSLPMYLIGRLPEVEFFGLGRCCRIRCIVCEGMRGDFVIPAVVHEPVDGLMA